MYLIHTETKNQPVKDANECDAEIKNNNFAVILLFLFDLQVMMLHLLTFHHVYDNNKLRFNKLLKLILHPWIDYVKCFLHACMLSCFSCVQLFETLCSAPCQAPLSMEFSRQQYRSGLPCSPPGDLSNSGLNLHLTTFLALHVGSLPLAPPGKPKCFLKINKFSGNNKEKNPSLWLDNKKQVCNMCYEKKITVGVG